MVFSSELEVHGGKSWKQEREADSHTSMPRGEPRLPSFSISQSEIPSWGMVPSTITLRLPTSINVLRIAPLGMPRGPELPSASVFHQQ